MGRSLDDVGDPQIPKVFFPREVKIRAVGRDIADHAAATAQIHERSFRSPVCRYSEDSILVGPLACEIDAPAVVRPTNSSRLVYESHFGIGASW